jgi:SPFH domain / Band 7 family
MLRGVLDDASGKWGIRVTRVEIKAIDPPKSVIDAMEKQMRAEREKRAAILTAEGVRQAQILTADGDKQGNVLRAEGEKQSAILRAEGQATAIGAVFQSIHDNDPDPKLLAYQYLQTLPQLAQGEGNTVWMIPSELTGALKMLSSAFGGPEGGQDAAAQNGSGPAGRPAWPQALSQSPAGGAEVTGPAASAGALAAPENAAAVVAAGAASAQVAEAELAAHEAEREADAALAAAVQEADEDTAQVGGSSDAAEVAAILGTGVPGAADTAGPNGAAEAADPAT